MSNDVYQLHGFFEVRALTAAYNLDTWKNFQGNILKYLKELFDEYLKHIEKDWNIALPGDKAPNMIFRERVHAAKTKAKNISESVIDALGLYLQGSTHQAQECLFSTLDGNIMLDHVKKDLEPNNAPYRLFRIRVSDNTSEIQARKDMFHVPFTLRHKIGTNRYSIPGYPCLYLSSSIYTCWEEMGRPPFHKIVLARFEPHITDKQPIFYLHHAPLQWREYLENKIHSDKDISPFAFDEFTSYLIHWPLQLACAIPLRNSGALFHEEYIIPQMLMQWVRSNKKVHGFCFRTTHVPQLSAQHISPRLLANYAFPARSTVQDYCSELTKEFWLTEPQSFELSLACKRRGSGNSNPHLPVRGFDQTRDTPFSLSTLSQGYYSYYEHAAMLYLRHTSFSFPASSAAN